MVGEDRNGKGVTGVREGKLSEMLKGRETSPGLYD
jgi:hypothetical protein